MVSFYAGEMPEEEMTEAESPESVSMAPPPEMAKAPFKDASCPPPLT